MPVMSANPKTKSGADSGADSGARNEAENINERETEILALIKKDQNISRRVLAQKLNIGTTTVYRHIKSLKEKGIIERVGGDRGGYWKINKHG